MSPAFSSTKQAGYFALILLFLLLLPLIIAKSHLPPRVEAYDVQGWDNGPYPWLRQQIFVETSDIDIAFIGSSHMLLGINVPYVQAALSKKLGRPAVVRMIGWVGAGYDGLFLIAQDLLQHRKVHLLVFYDEAGNNLRNAAIPSLFRFGENAETICGLSLTDKGIFYFASVIGMPRTLLSLVRSNVPAQLLATSPGYIEPRDKSWRDAPNRLGAVAARWGYKDLSYLGYTPFASYRPLNTQRGGASVFSASKPSKDFEFSNDSLPTWEASFARQFSVLAEGHGCKLVMLHIPTTESVQAAVIQERAFWPDIFSSNITLVGIPPKQIFMGLVDAEIKMLYSDKAHLNQNGMEYFTPLITSALLELYDAPANH